MSAVDIDPARVRAFADQLRGFTAFVTETLATFRSQAGALREAWPDEKGIAFQAELAKASERLQQFIGEADKIVPQLRATAERAEDIHRS